jgi:hypothetical protein
MAARARNENSPFAYCVEKLRVPEDESAAETGVPGQQLQPQLPRIHVTRNVRKQPQASAEARGAHLVS